MSALCDRRTTQFSRDAAPVECSGDFTTGCYAAKRKNIPPAGLEAHGVVRVFGVNYFGRLATSDDYRNEPSTTTARIRIPRSSDNRVACSVNSRRAASMHSHFGR